MIKRLYILAFLTGFNYTFAQNCKDQLVSDSLYKPNEKHSYPVSVLNCPLKNGGKVQFINNSGKFVLKITPNQKLGFLDVGSLQIKSGSKSFFLKTATYYDHKEPNAYFLVDVLINYIATLKDDGLTAIVFNEKFESELCSEDVKNVRRTAKCFYELYKK
jgi:hypothetical protein